MFLQSPVIGTGFGTADRGFPVQPANLFYFSLLVEIGLIGILGALWLMLTPIFRTIALFLYTPTKKETELGFLLIPTSSFLFGILFWSLGEFDILGSRQTNSYSWRVGV